MLTLEIALFLTVIAIGVVAYRLGYNNGFNRGAFDVAELSAKARMQQEARR